MHSDDEILGYICVIEESDFPTDLPEDVVARLQNYGTGTQLMVRLDSRKQGIGSSLFRQSEQWLMERGKAGYWLITHRRAYWYLRDFGYEETAKVQMKGVAKTILTKKF